MMVGLWVNIYHTMETLEVTKCQPLTKRSVNELTIPKKSVTISQVIARLCGGGFKHFLLSSLYLGEMIQFDEHMFPIGLTAPPSRNMFFVFFFWSYLLRPMKISLEDTFDRTVTIGFIENSHGNWLL